MKLYLSHSDKSIVHLGAAHFLMRCALSSAKDKYKITLSENDIERIKNCGIACELIREAYEIVEPYLNIDVGLTEFLSLEDLQDDNA